MPERSLWCTRLFTKDSVFPVIEAMASGCPVITTHHGSLAEVAGEQLSIISGHDSYEMLSAFHRVQEPAQRRRLIEAGIKQAALFRWDETVERFQELLRQAHDERLLIREINFHRRWKELRSAQGRRRWRRLTFAATLGGVSGILCAGSDFHQVLTKR